jgi:glutamyl-tRNA reductase
MQRLVLVGLNHTTAPLAVREKLVFTGPQRQAALREFRARYPEAEAVLVSTCNRVELYVGRTIHGHPRADEMIEFLASSHGLPGKNLEQHFYHRADRDGVMHLFSVASSLDSMVLGETQILGQVRAAYDAGCATGTVGALLNPLFQRAIAVGRQVMSQTSLSEGRLSVASVAVDYARRIFDHFNDKTVLSIGAGKMAQLVLKSFHALKPGRLLVCNRNTEKAAALAEKFGGVCCSLEQLPEHLVAADIVISSTGATEPIITAKLFQPLLRQRRYRPVFLIDIALPRDIDPAVGELENVYLYNIDDLQEVVASTQSQRQAAVDAARIIVEQQVEDFAAWNRTRQVGPLIDALYRRSHDIARQEVCRMLNKLPNLSEAERAHLDDLGRRIVNKLLHDPIHQLRTSDSLHAPTAQYLNVLERLFHLKIEEKLQEETREKTGDGQ